jgi:multidrug efflux pump subunit AcrA (membrane-fusion protein)
MFAVGVEFARNVAAAGSLDEVYWALTNDLRALTGFDRCFLLTHLGGASKFVSATALAAPEKKSRYYTRASALAASLKTISKPFLVAADQVDRLPEHGFPREAAIALRDFALEVKSSYFFILPILGKKAPIAHLVMEFLDRQAPDQGLPAMLSGLQPFFACALEKNWLLRKKPGASALLEGSGNLGRLIFRFLRTRRNAAVALGLVAVAAILFAPFERNVGGAAQVTPAVRHIAFTGVDGLISQVFVKEGDEVERGRLLALTDSKEIDFKIGMAQREAEILTKEMAVLRDGASTRPANLAQAELVELNRRKVFEELTYLRAQRDLLEIRSPVAGAVTTKNVESLTGKRFNAGEPFCELAAHGDLTVEIYVSDQTVTHVRADQPATLYLNADPMAGRRLTVESVAPKAEALPRLGNVYRVRARLTEQIPGLKSGMKGIGKIRTGSVTAAGLILDRIALAWNSWIAGPPL